MAGSKLLTIANSVLGKFDPSLLQNDSYILRLEVADNGGHISYVENGTLVKLKCL
ncbi:MAG: hypothetical protein RMY64_13805 [Nostoc sp. DedQUE08]|uniref:hypothetical protein n=1 Tax=unclassified Nostoc TaxID=2593658 RepID=UPI002AD25AF2|nr:MULTISPECIES: hypothetical protein [unclassified Nostoc]MDZ8034060.1 hypothetical protein [Nostoc sp. DedSLP04]MDZ8066674.1 hypothetical protein [Nostoc sp. DedQUE08]MDZ8093513.1 hypothetical protein [Nostoc sp. DedQUE05]